MAGESPSMESTYGFCPSAKMVSNASDDLPEPETPVMTTRRLRGMSQEMLRRLCCRAPRIRRKSMGRGHSNGLRDADPQLPSDGTLPTRNNPPAGAPGCPSWRLGADVQRG